MHNQLLHIIQKAFFIVIGIVMIINVLFLFFISNINTGIIITFALGVIFLFYGIFFKAINRKIPKYIICIFIICIISVIFLSSFLFIYGNTDTVKYNENAIIVLGSGIRGEQLTENLKKRIGCAIEYYYKYPDVIIVVSGGQGPQENITESLAMERYIISKGIPKSKILKENCATSTYQNFIYSKQLLDDYFDGEYNVTFVTNDYHIYRADFISKIAGYNNATHMHNATPWYLFLPSYLRECVAVLKLWVFDK